MRLVFMGTASFAVPALEGVVAAGHAVSGVVAQPDRPGGRGLKTQFSPVKHSALSLRLPLFQPDSLKTSPVQDWFRSLAPEIVIVAAYGKIIPPWLLGLPRHGVLNVHGSLLPKYRGAAPVNWAIVRGEVRTGVCTMRMDQGLDTGPVYLCEETPIAPEETAPELSARLAVLGARLLLRTMDGVGRGTVRPTPQDDSQATLAPRLRKQDGYIRWEESAADIHNKVRAFVPWPAVTVGFRGRACRILATRRTLEVGSGKPPGTIIFDADRLKVVCGDDRLLAIEELQLENRKAVDGRDFANGVRLGSDERFSPIGAG